MPKSHIRTMVPNCQKCFLLYLMNQLKNTNICLLKGHDFHLSIALVLYSFYFVIMAYDECHFTREEIWALRGVELASAMEGGQGRSGILTLGRPSGWVTLLSLASGQLHLRLSKMGADWVSSMFLKARCRTDDAVIWFWKITHICFCVLRLSQEGHTRPTW